MPTRDLEANDTAVVTMEGDGIASEQTPLLRGEDTVSNHEDPRLPLFRFLEAKTPAGVIYERFMIALILFNVLAFIVGSLFIADFNDASWAVRGQICGDWCDTILFGNYDDNYLQFLSLGSTSVLELITVAVFTVEYFLRMYCADLEDSKYAGVAGRLRWIPTFFSLVDIASTLPFYLDALVFRHMDIAASSFLRMFRLIRMMRASGRYETALSMVDDVIASQFGILGTALFVGFTTWMAVSSLYYLAERRNPDMIYCPTCDDTSACTIDDWGSVHCPEDCIGCYNMFESIPMASYYALLNLFGEFPLATTHSGVGKVVGVITAVVAVAVFALPVGIIGNGIEQVLESRRREVQPIREEGGVTPGYEANGATVLGRLYNLMHAHTQWGARTIENLINGLIIATAVSFMIDTYADLPMIYHILFNAFELMGVTIFTMEYILNVYSIKADPKYSGPGGRFKYMCTFLAFIDLLSFLPYWIEVILTKGEALSPNPDSRNVWSVLVQALRLLRIIRFERYTHAFLTFDDVVSRNIDVLAVTAFTALILWVFFASILYFSERGSPDAEIASNYKTIPHSMWITLLNLSGESPLSQYSFYGKIVTGIVGVFATGVFGIPIGVMGAGFEEIMEEENEDNEEELRAAPRSLEPVTGGSKFEIDAYRFANGMGSYLAEKFELLVYALIMVSVALGAYQTVEGKEDSFQVVEWIAVAVFTIEYLLRFIGARADPQFGELGPIFSRLRFIVSFYSIIDLLAIVPFYVSAALPNSAVNDYDEYLRMLRIIRLLKLDKYVPSITLIDDVIRLKFRTLRVAFFAAITLWILFSAALYLAEHGDNEDGIDPLPLYGCYENCTMTSRFQNFFESMVYTAIHLTGDYPIIEYDWPARFINFFMVIAAVGVVSIPSGLIASGFVQIVQSKSKRKRGETVGVAGDDWYEIRYRELEGVDPPSSWLGPVVDRWQFAVDEFLNGKKLADGTVVQSDFSFGARVFIFTVIILNIVAVMMESIPSIDRAVGNQPGNAFDTFEFFSVMVFALEYMLRLFCAPKNREALFSTFVYATTFFGIIDFLSTAPWFIEKALVASGRLDESGDNARIFRIFRIFRFLQLEGLVVANGFRLLDNVFRASQDVLRATGLMAMIVWVGCGALFFIFEENNPNWRTCDDSIPAHTEDGIGCYDFASTKACNDFYPGKCSQYAFTDMPDALYYTAVFLGGEWGVVDFTFYGRFVCLFLCIVGIGLYSIPIGTLFDSFGAVLGIGGDDEEEEEELHEE